MAVADVDRAGFPDILFTEAEGNALDVVRGAAAGLDPNPISLGVGGGPRGLAVADFNGDGIPDVAIADSLDDDVMVLLSTGMPTAVTSSLVTADVEGTTARLRWSVTGGGMVGIERATQHGGWAQIARVAPDGTGFVSYTDAGLSPGMSYGYRLRLGTDAASPVSNETWLSVPLAASLALNGTLENPSHGVIHASISLPGSSPARLQLFDITGRLIESRDVGSLGAGNHVVALNGGRAVQPGVYLVRLSAMGKSLSARVVAFQ